MPAKPITPNEIVDHKAMAFPDAIIASFNEAIARHYSSGEAIFTQDEVVKLIMNMDSTLTHEQIIQKGYLNVEEMYRANGWYVTYDKPGYNETYPASFRFRRKRK